MKPKMIIFDYGHTLIYERNFDFQKGYRKIFEYVAKNPDNITSDEMMEFSEGPFSRADVCRKQGFEIHEFPLLRATAEYFGLEFSQPIEFIEKILWDNSSEHGVMPNAEALIDFLNEHGIRTGVVSNIGWSGGALKSRLDEMLPNNRFEFVIASSEYAIRKPDPILFQIALRKAGLQPSEVWFCGDNITADVEGAHKLGIFPVYYDCAAEKDPNTRAELPVDFEYLHIHDWCELINILK